MLGAAVAGNGCGAGGLEAGGGAAAGAVRGEVCSASAARQCSASCCSHACTLASAGSLAVARIAVSYACNMAPWWFQIIHGRRVNVVVAAKGVFGSGCRHILTRIEFGGANGT